MRQLIFCILILVLNNNLFGQHSQPDTIIANYCKNTIKLNGILNEDCWENAKPVQNFTQREQNEGAPATEKTKVAVIYNKNNLYFGVWCYDKEPPKISAQKMVRDFDWGSEDNFEIMLSPFNDNRNGFLFVINPNGARADVWVGNEGEDLNKDWNGVWDVAVNRNQNGWFAEMVIPFSTLAFSGDSVQVWGINMERNIRRKKEQLLWQGWSRQYDVEKISQGGKLTGLNGIEQDSKIEIKPYGLGGIEIIDDKANYTGKAGGEININITPTLKLNFTGNTDFAQVEADRRQINLSRFSLYYPEKRQFFLEGKNYYNFNIGKTKLFYSRRIGIEKHTEIPIIGGTRFFGKLNKTNIGAMSLQTAAKDSIPTTNYSVVRVKQDILKQSSIGFITTQKHSRKGYNRVYGTDLNYSTSELFGDKNLITGGAVSVSQTEVYDSNEERNNNNLSYNVFLNYPNDEIEYDFGLTTKQKDFNPEMGFSRRKNYQMLYTELQFNPRFKKLPFFRNLIFKPIDVNYYINPQTNKKESIFYEWRPLGFVTKSGEFMEFNVQHVFDKPEEDFELFEGYTIPAGRYWDNRYEVQLKTFQGRKISGYGYLNIGDFYTGDRIEFAIFTNLNVNKHLNIGMDWQRNFINLPDGSFTTHEIGSRVDYAFNPKLNTSMFAQWNNEREHIVINYRLNWIPKIGSSFYFVINQDISTENRIKIEKTTIIGKLIWRFAI